MLDVAEVCVAYGDSSVLHDVTVDVQAGDLTCLMGRNGMGKTTLMNSIMGLLPLRSGAIRFDGTDLAKLATHRRARLGIGYVPQGQVGFPGLSVRENLNVVVEATRSRDRGALDEAVDLFPALAELWRRPAGVLSGGQRQQLAMARALASRPRLLILDEPTEGIQPSIITQIEDAIHALHVQRGLTILLVEQYVDFALRLSDSYAVMEAGRIVSSGATADIDAAGLAASLTV